MDVTWWELGGQVCGVFRALLTYCLLGTSGLGLQTVLLFVSIAWQNVCSPQKGIKLLFLLSHPFCTFGTFLSTKIPFFPSFFWIYLDILSNVNQFNFSNFLSGLRTGHCKESLLRRQKLVSSWEDVIILVSKTTF